MSRKKNFYEILEVSPKATDAEIRAAHLQKHQELNAQEGVLSLEEIGFQQKILKLAFDTLANPSERDAYDAKLSVPLEAEKEVVCPGLELMPSDSDDLARRAAALALRADALALRADALLMRTDVAPFQNDDTPKSTVEKLLSAVKSPVKRLLIAVGTVAAVAMVVQVSLVVFAVRKVENTAELAAKAEEKIILQEHFQKYGVRPANIAEARLLEAEYRRKEDEARKAQYEQKMKEDETRQFLEDSKRLGDSVSANLRYEEEQARRDEAFKKAQQEEEERNKKEAENERIRSQQEKWRSVLSR